MSLPHPVRVIGCGSPHGDDAVAWEVVRRLRLDERLPVGVELRTVEGGNQLLDVLDGRGTLVLVDAISSGAEPGAIHRFAWPDARLQTLRPGTTHHVRPAEALQLAATLGVRPPRVVVVGIEAASVQETSGLSTHVAAAVPVAVDRILDELVQMNEALTVRDRGHRDAMRRAHRAAARVQFREVRTMKFRSGTLIGVSLWSLVGVFAGVGGHAFYYADGASYLSNDPRACVNCHIMREQYDGWQKASHHAVATCNDCHVPHDFVGKYLTKLDNGYHHSRAFTLQDFHEPIRIRPVNLDVLNRNCVFCHGELTSAIRFHADGASQTMDCVRCHDSVGHGPGR